MKQRRHTLPQLGYAALIVYYWALQFTVGLDDQVQRGGVLYFLFIVPVAVFSVALLCGIRFRPGFNRPSLWMGWYLLLVCIVSTVRADTQTIATMGLLSIGVIVIFTYRLTPSTRLLNWLFLAAVPVNAIMFTIDRTIYAVVPGLSNDPEMPWRISLFPLVPTSAFYALIVLVVNLLRADGPMRRTCILLAAYFLIFSGLRSALIALLLIGVYALLARRGRVRTPGAARAWLAAFIGVFVTSLFSPQLVLLLGDLGPLNQFLFRTEAGIDSEEDASRAIYRTWLWLEHLRIAESSPVFGIGTFEFGALTDYEGVGGDGAGTEAFLTGLYARVGVLSLLLVLAFVSATARNVGRFVSLQFSIGLTLFIAMLAYGSFVAMYDLIFLVMVGLLAETPRPKPLLQKNLPARSMHR